MKKLLIVSLIVAGFVAVIPARAQVVQTGPQCPVAPLSLGSRGADVTKLQQILVSQNLLHVEPTGYFGVITKRAVAEYQAKNGVTPAAGYFGSITRGTMIAADVCSPTAPTPTSPITVTSPKAGDVVKKGSVVAIMWTDSNVYIQAQKYNITLIPKSPCTDRNRPCPLFLIKPYDIASDVTSTSAGYQWTVGTTIEANRSIPTGDYTVRICTSGGEACAESGQYVTITE